MVVVDGSDVVDVVVVVVQLVRLVQHFRFVYVSRCFVQFGFASVRLGVVPEWFQGLNSLNDFVTTVAATFELPDLERFAVLELLAVPVVVLVSESVFRSWFQSCKPFLQKNST